MSIYVGNESKACGTSENLSPALAIQFVKDCLVDFNDGSEITVSICCDDWHLDKKYIGDNKTIMREVGAEYRRRG